MMPVFFSDPKSRRLLRDHEEMVQLRDESSILEFEARGNPPDAYQLTFHGRGLDVKEAFRDVHQVEISLGAEYPRSMAAIRWITPIRHPNINSGRVCFGNFSMSPFVRLTEVVEILWDMARMAVFNPHGGYSSADSWYAIMKKIGGFPVDPRILRDKIPPPAPEEPGEPEILIMGARRYRMGAVEGWAVTHDGETIRAGFANDDEAMKWLHDRHSYSVNHAVRYEVYDIVFVRGGKVERSYKRDILGKARKPEATPEDQAEAFEKAVRQAFIDVYGPPRDPTYVEQSIRSSYLKHGRKLGWTEPNPRVVLVLTEFGWVHEPYSHEEDHDNWNRVIALLTSRGWGKVGWDSINSAVQVVFQEKE